MRKKVLLLTLFMAICPFIFGQDPDWGEYDYHNWDFSTTITASVSIDGIAQTNMDLVIAPFCNNERRGHLCTPILVNNGTVYLYPIAVKGNQGDKITFKLFDRTLQTEYLVSEYDYTFKPNEVITGKTINFLSAAKVGDVRFGNINDAVDYAEEGDTVTITNDQEVAATVVISKDLTLDLNGKALTAVGDIYPVFRIQDEAEVTVTGEGSITNATDYVFVLGDANISTSGYLTIENGTFLGETTVASVTKGLLTITGGEFKISDVETYDYAYLINCYDANYQNGIATVAITGGTFYGFNPEDNAAEGEGTNFCVEGYIAKDNGDDSYTVIADPSIGMVARIGEVYYETLAAAVEAAKTDDVIYLICNAKGSGVVIDKSFTIDFDGFTYSFTEPAVGSTGTQSNGFQILKGNNVTLTNGTLNVDSEHSSKYYILVQNYADLNVIDMTLDGTNLDKWSTTDGDSYVLSNNCGEVNIGGATNIIANNDGDLAFAFDACDKSSWGYELPTVTVNTTGTIDGGIEVSANLYITAAELAERSYILMQENGEFFHNGIKATVKKPIKATSGVYGAKESWNTISTPVEGGSEIEEVEDGRHDLYWYDEDDQYWRYQETGNLNAGQGYLYTNHVDGSFSFTGKLNTKAVEFPLSYTEGNVLAGFNLVGNPFTYEISVENMTSEAVLADGFYTITKEGAWQARQGNEIIAPLKAVLVKADKAATLTINPKANNTRKASNASLEIAVSNGEYKDYAYVSFGEGLGLDKIEHRNSNIPMVFVPVNGKEYAIATMSSDVKEIPVAFKAMTMGQYTIEVNAKDCEYSEMYLVDRLTGEVTDLINNDYTFIATSNDNANRFVITFAAETVTSTTDNFAFISNDEIIIESIEGKGVVRIYDMLGRPISEYGVTESARIPTSAFANGLYIIQMSDDNGVKVQKVVID